MRVCLSGHVGRARSTGGLQNTEGFCPECGKPMIGSCPRCDSTIPAPHGGPEILLEGKTPPPFCAGCGEPYPWTDSRLRAARALADETEGLSVEERETLKASIDDLVKDTPATPLAATRYARLMGKLGQGAVEAFRRILVDVVSETTRKLIAGP